MRAEELGEPLSSSVLPRDSSAPAVTDPQEQEQLGHPRDLGLDGTV